MATPSRALSRRVQWRKCMLATTDLILLMLLGAHLLTLRLLWDCSRQMNGLSGGIPEQLTEFSDGMAEVIRIGSDLCDTVETLSMVAEAAPVASPAVLGGDPPPFDIGNTIMSLIASRMMAGDNGGQTIQDRPQEGTVYAETDETKKPSAGE